MKSNFLSRLLQRVLVLILICSTSSYATASEQQPIKQTAMGLSEQTQDVDSIRLERLGSGFANIIFGPLELFYQVKKEIERTNLVRGILPGFVRGISWFGVREGTGLYEISTFYLPLKPRLEPFDTSWLHA